MAKLKNLCDFKHLVGQESTFVRCVEKEHHLLLHPSHLRKPKEGIITELDALLNKYSTEFGGIVMGYKCVKVLSIYGMQTYSNPYQHVPIFAQFYVFSPQIGDTVKGTVVKKSAYHVGCLIHECYNISSVIPEDHPTDWIGYTVNENDTLTIKITFIDHKSSFPFFKGDIVSIVTSNVVIKTEENDSGISGTEIDTGNSQKKKKKNRKSKHEDLNGSIDLFSTLTDVSVLTNSPSKTSKNKSKKVKIKNEILSDENIVDEVKEENVSKRIKLSPKKSKTIKTEPELEEQQTMSLKKKKSKKSKLDVDQVVKTEKKTSRKSKIDDVDHVEIIEEKKAKKRKRSMDDITEYLPKKIKKEL